MDENTRLRMAELLMNPELLPAPGAQPFGSLVPRDPSQLERRAGEIKMREATGGEPAFWGPLQRLIFGYPLYGTHPDIVKMLMHGQMGQSQDISDAVPRPPVKGY